MACPSCPEFFNKFPKILKNALLSGMVAFPEEAEERYVELELYRGIFRYAGNDLPISRADFMSYVELDEVSAEKASMGDYGCSFYGKIKKLNRTLKAKIVKLQDNRQMRIAKGTVNESYGPVQRGQSSSHVNLWLYKGKDPSVTFEEVEENA